MRLKKKYLEVENSDPAQCLQKNLTLTFFSKKNIWLKSNPEGTPGKSETAWSYRLLINLSIKFINVRIDGFEIKDLP